MREKDPKFYGSVTVGERGQVVIPAQARQESNIAAGDKLLVFQGFMGSGVSFVKADQLTEKLSRAADRISALEKMIAESEGNKGEK